MHENLKPKSNTDPRVDFVRNAMSELDDNKIIINTRYGEGKAETAVGRPVSEPLEFPLSAGKVRLEFALFLSDQSGKQESIKEDDFAGLVEFFLEDNISSGVRDYAVLNEKQALMASDCLHSCKAMFLQAFSPEQFELTQVTLPTAEQDLERFFAQLETVDQAYACFEKFISNETYADIVANIDNAGQYAAFKVARITQGVSETPESVQALIQLAELLDIAS